MTTKDEQTSKGHGGKRRGAGRKARGKAPATPITIRFTPAELEAVEAAQREGESRSDAVRRLVSVALAAMKALEG